MLGISFCLGEEKLRRVRENRFYESNEQDVEEEGTEFEMKLYIYIYKTMINKIKRYFIFFFF